MPPPSFWSTPGGILFIAFVVLFLSGGLVTIGQIRNHNAFAQLEVQVTSCSGTETVATVGYTVKNNGKKARR